MRIPYCSLLLLGLIPVSSLAGETEDLQAMLHRDFPKLKQSEVKVVEKNDQGSLLLLFTEEEVYVAKPAKPGWKFIDHFPAEGIDDVEFKPGGKIAVNFAEGGSDHSNTQSVWRLEGDSMRIIGQDSTVYTGWNQGVVKKSVNYLSGKMTVSSSSQDSKATSRTCRFDPKKFRNQKLSELWPSGAREPKCGD